MAIACFVSSTTASIPNPSLFIPNANARPSHSILLPISPSHKSPAMRYHRRSSQTLALRCSSVATPPLPLPHLISDSTRTLSSLISLALSVVHRLFAAAAASVAATAPTPTELSEIQSLRGSLACGVGPLFFAALRDRPSGYLNTPLTVVASGMSKWLDIYSGVLMVRVLLSWFPNIPWDRQPLSAIRDLCDPYLNLFRNIIPPIFDTLDVSPLLAFAVLGTLGSILKSARGMY
ncbi:ylmG homolog protein 1-2, chloroplastic-like [Phalaenopsis equestris]|uniref:ylmG homolog protein 1-2, chloroplastic-like n=1 Tax=Phalaenopsis equestris TaxID=78828 RepID=UPI0009E322AB|nr:ylmG homolog protein 1-2, chloroplastic-like [Phalaenopsis equestris]XP_020583934.1 ylmG homolog protein 1-2, chloroplastic-like [Phalaenopsis equestris]